MSEKFKMQKTFIFMLALSFTGLAACVYNPKPFSFAVTSTHEEAYLKAIYIDLKKCVFAKRQEAFRRLVILPEFDTKAGDPRLLIVPKIKPTARPLLVISAKKEAEKNIINIYGKLLNSKQGNLIRQRSKIWQQQRSLCTK